MTTRRLPRSFRGRALPRSTSDEVTWPPALRGRPALLCLALLGWLGGGLLATAVATVTTRPHDLVHGLVVTAVAGVGLLLAMAVRPEDASRRRRQALDEPLPVHVPAQADPEHARRHPAVR